MFNDGIPGLILLKGYSASRPGFDAEENVEDNEEQKMDSIVTAGGRSKPEDPLFEFTGIEKKALIPLSGRPMIAWVVDAIWKSGLVEHIAVVGLEPGEVDFGDAPVYYTDAVGDIVSNVLAGLDRLHEVNPLVKKILLAITPEIIRGFVDECGSQEADGYYAIVEEKTMEARFPNSKRTFIPFKGGRYSGGDVLLVDVAAVKANQQLIRDLTGSRKDYWGQVRMLGSLRISDDDGARGGGPGRGKS